MTNLLKNIALSFLMFLFLTDLQAQRRDDNFLRRQTINRLDLEEKINFVLVRPAAMYPDEQSEFAYQDGIVDAMIKGMQSGKYVAYDPNDIKVSIGFEELEAKLKEKDYLGEPSNQIDVFGEDGTDWGEDADWDEFEGDDDLSEFEDFGGDDFEQASGQSGNDYNQNSDELDLTSYTMSLQFIEEWIFDKNTSSLRYDIKYFQLIWVDPSGTMPDEIMAVFRWDDISPVFAQTLWPNRHNEAENRSVKEVFDLRLFNSFLIDVSGQGMRTLDEAERWRKRLVEKEHNLYSY